MMMKKIFLSDLDSKIKRWILSRDTVPLLTVLLTGYRYLNDGAFDVVPLCAGIQMVLINIRHNIRPIQSKVVFAYFVRELCIGLKVTPGPTQNLMVRAVVNLEAVRSVTHWVMFRTYDTIFTRV